MSSKCVLGQSKSYQKSFFVFTYGKFLILQGNLIDIAQKRFLKSIPFWDGTFTKVSKLFLLKVPRDFVIYMFSTTVHTYLSHKCIYCMQFLNLKVKRFTLDFKFFRIIRSDRKTCCYHSLHGVDDKSMEYKTLFVV